MRKILDKVKTLRLPELSRDRKHLGVQLAGAVAVLWGIAGFSWQCAAIIGGITLILVIERQ